jgi:hypothetical protein
MKCPHCGAQVTEEGRFCEECGKPVSTTPARAKPKVKTSSPPGSLLAIAAAPPVPAPVEAEPDVSAPSETRLPLPRHPGRKNAPIYFISHWARLLDGLQLSSMEFYGMVREAVQERRIPGAKMAHVEWHEGNVFSPMRTYLRVSREEHVVDLCAAPFGAGFFVSWWLGDGRSQTVWRLVVGGIALVVFLSLLFIPISLVVTILGWIHGWAGVVVGLLLVLIGIPAFCLLLVRRFWEPLDDYLIQTAIVGPLYERFFRPVTYYRIDTALMFQTAVHGAVQEVIDRLTKAKNLRPLTELERKPIMRGFF